jgi:hypothetical protein
VHQKRDLHLEKKRERQVDDNPNTTLRSRPLKTSLALMKAAVDAVLPLLKSSDARAARVARLAPGQCAQYRAHGAEIAVPVHVKAVRSRAAQARDVQTRAPCESVSIGGSVCNAGSTDAGDLLA